MEKSPDFAVLDKFLVFAKDAFVKGELTRSSAFRYADGSFLSLLMGEYDDAPRTLKTMDALSSTLTELAHFVEEGLTLAREQLLPRIYNRGIYSLPVEVIADIIILLRGEDDSYQWRNILLVNRYFRDIALQIPSLWTKVNNTQNPRLHLERSGLQGLYITVKGRQHVRLRHFLELLEPHTSRWKALSFTVPIGRYIDLPQSHTSLALQSLRDEFQGRAFPILETLQIDYKDDAPLDEDGFTVMDNEHDPNVTLRSFFSTWDMPSLRCVDATGFIPVLPPGCLNNLTCLRLTLLGDRKDEGSIIWDVQTITLFLRSLGALEELSISLSMIDEFSNEDVPFELPRLQTLSVSLVNLYYEPIAALFSILSAPNTKHLALRVESYGCEDVCLALEVFMPRSEPRWPLLQSLHCTVDGGEYLDVSEFPLDFVFSRLPRLHNLTVEAGAFLPPARLALHQFYTEPGAHEHPPLRSLHLLDCTDFNMEFISTLRPIFDAPEFEILEISHCPKISMEEVRSILPEGKELKFK